MCYDGLMRPSKLLFVLPLALPVLMTLAALFAPQALRAQPQAYAAVTGQAAVMIELDEPPAAVVYASQQQLGVSAAASAAATQVQVAAIAAAQDQLQQQLAAYNTPVLFSVQRVYNGIAVLADETQRTALARLPGVKAVHPLIPKEPSNSASIPFLGIPALWQDTVGTGIPGGLHGEGVRVAVADTGIDYLHRDFGGPGTGYAVNDRTRIGDVPGYPGPRVVGGYDFVGDDYNASAGGDKSVPHPDPDPMDCYGHGTHVAGTAAGSGVTDARTTYTGPYDASIDYAKLYIGPGVAPRASVYALKIFGCDGSTNLTDMALEWAVDPNQDGDFGDHVDVINLSLGSPYGWEYDTSVAAANNAALAGVIVVASAGNNGDIQLITSAPASADRAISVAATQHVADTVASFSSRGPRRGDAGLKPDVAAPGTGIVSAKTGSGSERVSSSGTSMAAPHVTGLMALLRQAHPGWNVEELKALAMNTAMLNVTRTEGPLAPALLPVRTGAGRIAPQAAVAAASVFYAADSSGRVNLSFGAPEVSGAYTATHEVEIANKSTAPARFELTYSSLTNLPGVVVQTPSQPLLVPPGGRLRVPITLQIDAAKLRQVQAPADAGSYLLTTWFPEEGGHLYLWPAEALQTGAMTSEAGRHTSNEPAATLAASYQPDARTLSYTITLSGLDVSAVTSATLAYGAPGDNSAVLAGLAPLPPAGTTITGSLTLSEASARWLAAGLLHVRIEAQEFSGGAVRGQLLYGAPVLHLPLYAAPRPVAAMGIEPQTLSLTTGTTQTLHFAGSTLQGSSPPTDVVPLASLLELKLRSPNTRPTWLDASTPDRYDHADLQYVGVTSDAAMGLPAASQDARIYFGVTTWASWSTPNEIAVNILLDTNNDGKYEYRLANGTPTPPIFGSGPIGPLVAELYDLSNGRLLAQQPLNGVSPTRFETNPFFGNAMILPVKVADLGLKAAGGNLNFVVQTTSTDTQEGEGGYIDRSPVLHYDAARPAFLFSAPNAAAPLYLDRPDTTVDVAVDPISYALNPPAGVLAIHNHNSSGTRTEVVSVSYRWPFAGYLPFIGQRAQP